MIKAAAESGFKPEELIDFSANINFLGPPDIIVEKIKNNIRGIKNYPETNAGRVKKMTAEHHGLRPENVTVGNGASEIIYQISRVLKPKTVLIVEPTFSEYELAAKSAGAEVKHFFLEDDFKLDIDSLTAEFTEEIDLLFICNPNNPTASLLELKEIEEIAAAAAENEIVFVLDEAFNDFLPAAESYTALPLMNKYKNLIILRSLTKIFALPGLRLGYSLAHEEISLDLERQKDPWSVNYFAQLAAEIIFSGCDEIEEYLAVTRVNISAERTYLYSQLKNISALKVYQPTANYLFVDISKTALTSQELQNELLKCGILIRNCANFQGLDENYIRLAVKSRQNNNLLIAQLQQLIN